jgi:hypothetical protein
VSFKEFGDDLVLADEFGLELLDLFVLGVGLGFEFGVGLECGGAVLEEDLEPVVEGVDVEFVLIAQIGDGHLLDEVLLENRDLLRGRKHAWLGHTNLP